MEDRAAKTAVMSPMGEVMSIEEVTAAEPR